MATQKTRTYLLSRFEAGDRPTDQDFADLFESILFLNNDGIHANGLGTDTTTVAGDFNIGGTLDLTGNFKMAAKLSVGDTSQTQTSAIEAYNSDNYAVIYASGSLTDVIYEGVSQDTTASIQLTETMAGGSTNTLVFGTAAGRTFIQNDGQEILHMTSSGHNGNSPQTYISGSVGIGSGWEKGTIATGEHLHIQALGEGDATMRLTSHHTNNDSIIKLRQSNDTGFDLRYDGGIDKFQIKDNVGNLPFQIEHAADSNALYIDNSGRVGIGTNDPEQRLHVYGTSTPSIMVEASAGEGAFIRFKDDNQSWRLGKNTNDYFTVYDSTGGTTPIVVETGTPDNTLRLDASGRLGIGTSNPNQDVHIKDATGDVYLRLETDKTNGVAQILYQNDAQQWNVGVGSSDNFVVYDSTNTVTPFKIEPGAGSNSILVDSNSKVGIGTSSPSEKLSIVGGHISLANEYGIGKNISDYGGNGSTYGLYPYKTGLNTSYSYITALTSPSATSMVLTSDNMIGFYESDAGTLRGHMSMNSRTFDWDGKINAQYFYGDGSNLTNITGGQINGLIDNGANNRVITAIDADSLRGEDDLTWDGSKLGIGVASPSAHISETGAHIFGEDGKTATLLIGEGTGHVNAYMQWARTGTGAVAQQAFYISRNIYLNAAGDTWARSNGYSSGMSLKFGESANHNHFIEILRDEDTTAGNVPSPGTVSPMVHFDGVDGRVGIGTSSPGYLLHIKDGSSDNYLKLETDKVDGRAQVIFQNDAQQFQSGINAANEFIVYDATNTATPFVVEPGVATNTLYLDATDRVGIGKSSPGYKLHVEGSVMSSPSSTSGAYYLGDQADAGMYMSGNNVQVAARGDIIMMIDSNDNGTSNTFEVQKDDGAVNGGTVVFKVNEDGLCQINGGMYFTSENGVSAPGSSYDGVFDGEVGTTRRHRIYFPAATGATNSNDPGFIEHITGNSTAGLRNSCTIRLCPGDDSSGADYVAVGGGDENEMIRLFTSGEGHFRGGLAVGELWNYAGTAVTDGKVSAGVIHIKSNADAGLILEADVNNSGESNNPYVRFLQDGSAFGGYIGMVGDVNKDPQGNSATDIIGNSMYIGTDFDTPVHLVQNNASVLTINSAGMVGIGGHSPSSGTTGAVGKGSIEVSGYYGRTTFNTGMLVGNYNQSGGSVGTGTNPIYVIGSNYRPDASTLNNMYGIGYTKDDASFIGGTQSDTWGLYVAADGDARVWFGASANSEGYFNTGGWFGFGTDSPDAPVHVKKGSNYIKLFDQSLGSSKSYLTIHNSTSSHKISALNLKIDSTNLWQVGVDNGSGNRFFVGYNNDSAKRWFKIEGDGHAQLGADMEVPEVGLTINNDTSEMLRLDDTSSTGNPYMTFFQDGTRRSFIQHVNNGGLRLTSEFGYIHFRTAANDSEVTRLTITSDGNIYSQDNMFYIRRAEQSVGIGGAPVVSGVGGIYPALYIKTKANATIAFSYHCPSKVKHQAEHTLGRGIVLVNDSNGYHWALDYANDRLSFGYRTTGETMAKGYLTSGRVNQIVFTGQHKNVPETGVADDYTDKVGYIVISTGDYWNLNVGLAANNAADSVIEQTKPSINESLPKIALSGKANDKRVFGVISDAEDSSRPDRIEQTGVFHSVIEKDDNRIWVNSLGEGAIMVSNYNGNLENGDYITTSPLEGLGMKQDDDLLHNYTVAKITQDEDFSEGASDIGEYKFKLVGCTYHCG